MATHTRTVEDLTSEIQRTLALLADVETRYELERELLSRSLGPPSWEDRVRCALEARRRRDREPLAQRLADLQRQVTSSAWFSRVSAREWGTTAAPRPRGLSSARDTSLSA